MNTEVFWDIMICSYMLLTMPWQMETYARKLKSVWTPAWETQMLHILLVLVCNEKWNTPYCPLKTKFSHVKILCVCLHPVLTCWTNNKYVMVYQDQVSWENLYWTFQIVAEECTIARGEPTSCNHDNCGYCKVPSAAFHLDLDIHDLLLQEMMRNKYTRSPLFSTW